MMLGEAPKISLRHSNSNNNSKQCLKLKNQGKMMMTKAMKIRMFPAPIIQQNMLTYRFHKMSKIYSNTFKDISHKR